MAMQQFDKFKYSKDQELTSSGGIGLKVCELIVFTSGLKQKTAPEKIAKLSDEDVEKLGAYVRLYDCLNRTSGKRVIFSEKELCQFMNNQVEELT